MLKSRPGSDRKSSGVIVAQMPGTDGVSRLNHAHLAAPAVDPFFAGGGLQRDVSEASDEGIHVVVAPPQRVHPMLGGKRPDPSLILKSIWRAPGHASAGPQQVGFQHQRRDTAFSQMDSSGQPGDTATDDDYRELIIVFCHHVACWLCRWSN
jgi:hypothetical protein